MKKDNEIQKNVMEELKNLPSLHASEIGVAVKNGIVTLSGVVDSYPRKIAVERTVIKVKNVRGIAEDIQVKLNGSCSKTDSEIAQAVLYSIEWHSGLDPEKIKVHVEDGIVTINGKVDWDYQRKLAQKTAANITGVRGLINNIEIMHRPVPGEIKEKIQSSFVRNANIDSGKITIDIEGNKVILKGKVKCQYEKKEAENTVWSLPGVSKVENKLECEEQEEIV
jgi:osmotically-inducible protein OsmY